MYLPEEVLQGEVVPGLREGLKNADSRIAWNAVVGLANFEQADVVRLLNEGLSKNEGHARWEAVFCLHVVHDEESVFLLGELITDTEATLKSLRQEAAMTLGRIGDPAAVPALLTALEDPQAGVRWRAALALSKIGDLEAIPAIEAALEKETDEYAVEQIQIAIERLREASMKDEEESAPRPCGCGK